MDVTIIIVLLTLGYFPIGLAGYCFGWWLRGKTEVKLTRFARTDEGVRPMTAQEQKDMEEAFRHMGIGFGHMEKVFKN